MQKNLVGAPGLIVMTALLAAGCAAQTVDEGPSNDQPDEAVGANSAAMAGCPQCISDTQFRLPYRRPPIIFVPALPNPDDFVSITAGMNHTCVRKYNGNVYCWGQNDEGQTGTGPSTTCSGSGVTCVNRPSQVTGSFSAASQIDAGGNHTCALDNAGAAFCWGSASNGQLGVGVFGYLSSPTAVSGGLTFSSISAGTYSTCGTTSSGLYCWGGIMFGGGAAGSGNPSPSPVLSLAGATVQGYGSVTVGYLHGCAMANGAVDCWGYDRWGQAGQDPAVFPNVPATLATLFGTSVGRVKTQDNFTCVDQNNGTVQCIGAAGWGQLGNGSYADNFQPQSVGNGQLLQGVDTGFNHACALDPSGAAYCWGNGYWGQLGHGASNVVASPAAVTGGHTYRAIAAGYQHTCAIGTDNHIYCWGSNHYGQLGTQYPGGWVWSPVQAIDP